MWASLVKNWLMAVGIISPLSHMELDTRVMYCELRNVVRSMSWQMLKKEISVVMLLPKRGCDSSVPVRWVRVGRLHWSRLLWTCGRRMGCWALVLFSSLSVVDAVDGLISKSHSRPPDFLLWEKITAKLLQWEEGTAGQGDSKNRGEGGIGKLNFRRRGHQHRPYQPCILTCTYCSFTEVCWAWGFLRSGGSSGSRGLGFDFRKDKVYVVVVWFMEKCMCIIIKHLLLAPFCLKAPVYNLHTIFTWCPTEILPVSVN